MVMTNLVGLKLTLSMEQLCHYTYSSFFKELRFLASYIKKDWVFLLLLFLSVHLFWGLLLLLLLLLFYFRHPEKITYKVPSSPRN
jgi:hypothetical protein